MQYSKLILFILALAVSACTPTKKSADQLDDLVANADFRIVKASGSSTADQLIQGASAWQASKVKSYNFKACLNTKAADKKIRDVQFTVMGANDEEGRSRVIVDRTDPEGCLEWQDNIQYSQYVEGTDDITVQYRIYAQGENNIYKGMAPARFIINPWTKSSATYWATGSQPSIPVSRLIENTTFSTQRLSGKDKEGAYPLTMDLTEFSASFPDTTSPNGFRVEMDLRFKPGVELPDASGKKITRLIESGQFRLRAQLVATEVDGVNKSFIILPEEPTAVRTVRRGEIRFRLRAEVGRQAYRGRLKLAVKIEPHGVGAPDTLDPYEGLFLIGRADKRPYSKPHLQQDSIGRSYDEGVYFSFDEYMRSHSNFEELKEQLMAFDVYPFEFDTAVGTYEQVQPGETATQRSVAFRVRTCISDGGFGEKIKKRKFKVTRVSENGTKKVLSDDASTTDREGCFSWPGVVSHGVYKKERIIPVHYDVEYDYSAYSQETDAGTAKPEPFKHRKTVYVNPWDDKFTFARDAIEIDREAQAEREATEKIESRFFISSYKYETLKFGYELDKNLNLKVNKSILLNLEPWVLRYNGNVKGRDTVNPLRDGIYLLKVAYQKDYLDPATKGIHILRSENVLGKSTDGSVVGYSDPQDRNNNRIVESHERFFDLADDRAKRIRKQYISTVSKLVRVNRGKIITPIEIQLRDLRLLRVRSQFLFQLQPIDERMLVVANNLDNEYTEEMTAEIEKRFDALIEQVRAEGGDEQVEKVLQSIKMEASEYDALNAKRVALNKHMYEFFGEQEQIELEQLALSRQAELEGVLDQLSSNVFKRLWFEENRLGESSVESASSAARELNLEKDSSYMAAQREFMERSKSGQLLDQTITEFDISNDIIGKIQEDYVTNDFTTMSTAPLVKNLDVFVEPYEVSGLKRRTFIGPVTFLRNANNGRVRPTDNLAELYGEESTVDSRKWAGITSLRIMKGLNSGSDAVSEERNEKYYQSVKHFTRKHVDDLIAEQDRLDREFEIEQKAFANLSNYVNLYDFEFISLVNDGGEPESLHRVTPNTSCSTIYRPNFFEDCYEPDLSSVVPLSEFLAGYNKFSEPSIWVGLAAGKRPKLSKTDLLELLNVGGRSALEEIAKVEELADLPRLFGAETYEDFVSITGLTNPQEIIELVQASTKAEVRDILGSARTEDMQAILAPRLQQLKSNGGLTDKHMYNMCYLFVNAAKKANKRMKAGELLEKCKASIGTVEPPFIVEQKVRVEKIGKKVFKGGKQMNVNVGQGIGLSRDERMSFGTGIAGIKLFNNVLKPVAPILGTATGFVRLSYDYGRGKSSSIGTSISKQTFLVMQTAAFDIQFKEYRRCAVIRWNPKMFVPALHNVMGNRGTNFDVPGGYMVCENSVVTDEPLYVREHYYYFTQHFTDGDLLDPGDLYNHPWLLALRGVGDAARFLSLLEKNNYVLYKLWGSEQFECANGLDISGEQRHETQEYLCKNYHQWPIQKMINVYLKTTPTIPGIYTMLKETDPDFPWTETPKQSIESYKSNPISDTSIGVQNKQDYVLGLPQIQDTSELSFENLEQAVDGVKRLRNSQLPRALREQLDEAKDVPEEID